jgi:hypothetical protein
MTWRPWFMPSVIRQLGGLPPEVLEFLIPAMVEFCIDPFSRVHSKPLRGDRRLAELGDFGWLEFEVDHEAGLLRVYRLVWTG